MAEALFNRAEVFAKRRGSQIQTVDFPTTSIGSFPQTAGACAAMCVLPPHGDSMRWVTVPPEARCKC